MVYTVINFIVRISYVAKVVGYSKAHFTTIYVANYKQPRLKKLVTYDKTQRN